MKAGPFSPYDPVALLAYDRAGAGGFGPPDGGVINSGLELFGDQPLTPGGLRPANGFDKLAAFDENGDGWIDGHDPIFAHLTFWRDAPRDGVCEPHELTSITMHGVEAISLDYHRTQRADMNGNSFRYMSLAKIGGKTEPVYDVFLKHE